MKRKWMAGCRITATIMTLVLFLLFWQNVGKVYASAGSQAPEEAGTAGGGTSGEEENANGKASGEAGAAAVALPGETVGASEVRLMKVISLTSGEMMQVPRYIVEGDAVYVLDEASIVVEETGRGSSEGADVVTFSRKEENLPDNDLERIEKTALHEGVNCELLSVVYEVAGKDANGIPTAYNAVCEYGGLKKYSTSYPTAWQMTVCYDFLGTAGKETAATVQEEYEYVRVPARQKAVETEKTERADIGETESDREREEELPDSAVKKFRIKPAEDEKERKRIMDTLLPYAATAAGTGIVLPFILWFTIVTAPLFTWKKGEKYRRIGRIRLKKEDGTYTAYLTGRLLARAEVPTFLIKLPGRVRKKTKAGMLQIHCPGGKRILLTAGREVHFTVEGD